MIHISLSCGSNGDISPNGTLELEANTDLDVTATPHTGYRILNWYVNGQAAGWEEQLHHFSFGDLDVAIHVEFERLTNLVHTSTGGNGQLSPDGSTTPLRVGWGDAVHFTATPAAHYHTSSWTVDGLEFPSSQSIYILPSVTSEHWVAVNFAVDTYTVQAQAGLHGTLSPTGAITVVYGENQSFTATPDHGWDVVLWTLNGKPVSTNQPSLLLSEVGADQTLEVTFSKPLLKIGLTSTNTPLVSWPSALNPWHLQESTNLHSAWTDVSTAPVSKNGLEQVILPQPIGPRFYQLYQP